ncbi:hypothetical protein LCGC14_0731970 [marine sediment metagenome]|uniref:Uncharacterized protein n=1 Tax=marine sediment metagenome TaxID=412755 RepID=A0A0F9SUE7_9ZZZZ
MCKLNKWGDTRIDPCMRQVIRNLQGLKIRTLACCCGHGKYPMTIIVDIGISKLMPLEIFSNVMIERKKKYYKKDKQGYYYIPETIDQEK